MSGKGPIIAQVAPDSVASSRWHLPLPPWCLSLCAHCLGNRGGPASGRLGLRPGGVVVANGEILSPRVFSVTVELRKEGLAVRDSGGGSHH